MKNVVHPFRRLITRHLRRQHARFDREAGINTAARVTLAELGLSADKSTRYEATPIHFFHSLIAKLHLDYQKTVFVDFGSGKGRTLLLASHYPFRSIVGVEISPMLCEIARDNITRYRVCRPQSSDISIFCKGIDEFEYEGLESSHQILVYMFNPCSASVLQPALQKLFRLVAKGVSVTIIYVNPVCLDVLTSVPWLRQVRYGETFDDTGNSFMEYVVLQALPPPWKETVEVLMFQFGPWVLAKWTFSSISNAANPLVNSTSGKPPVFQPITYQQMPDDGTFHHRLTFERGAIHYVPYRGKRYFIDLSNGSFDEYFQKFSSRTRNTLKRKVRRFRDFSGGTIDLRIYASPEEMTEFRRHAITVSLLTYQKKIGWAFPEDAEFERHLIDEAKKGRVRGFVLMHDKRPVAYAFCRTRSEVITYAILGHDPALGGFSPGTVLLILVIRRIFLEGKFRVFDFGGMEVAYKSFFATAGVDYVKSIWFPITARNLILVAAHYLVLHAWRAAAWLNEAGASRARRAKVLLTPRRMPSKLPARSHDIGPVSISARAGRQRRVRR